jgi:hypothetical protein
MFAAGAASAAPFVDHKVHGSSGEVEAPVAVTTETARLLGTGVDLAGTRGAGSGGGRAATARPGNRVACGDRGAGSGGGRAATARPGNRVACGDRGAGSGGGRAATARPGNRVACGDPGERER